MNEAEYRTTMGPTFHLKAGQPTPEGMRVWAVIAIKSGSKLESFTQYRDSTHQSEGDKVEVEGDFQKALGVTSYPVGIPFIFEGWIEDVTIDADDTTSEFFAYYTKR